MGRMRTEVAGLLLVVAMCLPGVHGQLPKACIGKACLDLISFISVCATLLTETFSGVWAGR